MNTSKHPECPIPTLTVISLGVRGPELSGTESTPGPLHMRLCCIRGVLPSPCSLVFPADSCSCPGMAESVQQCLRRKECSYTHSSKVSTPRSTQATGGTAMLTHFHCPWHPRGFCVCVLRTEVVTSPIWPSEEVTKFLFFS